MVTDTDTVLEVTRCATEVPDQPKNVGNRQMLRRLARPSSDRDRHLTTRTIRRAMTRNLAESWQSRPKHRDSVNAQWQTLSLTLSVT